MVLKIESAEKFNQEINGVSQLDFIYLCLPKSWAQ